jgi:hypothetical protein
VNGDEQYERARKRVEELKGFYIHVIIYVLVNLGIFLMNILGSPGQLWFFWSLIGWGIGLVAHAVGVFGVSWIFGREWEERKIAEIAEKMGGRAKGGAKGPDAD